MSVFLTSVSVVCNKGNIFMGVRMMVFMRNTWGCWNVPVLGEKFPLQKYILAWLENTQHTLTGDCFLHRTKLFFLPVPSSFLLFSYHCWKFSQLIEIFRGLTNNISSYIYFVMINHSLNPTYACFLLVFWHTHLSFFKKDWFMSIFYLLETYICWTTWLQIYSLYFLVRCHNAQK